MPSEITMPQLSDTMTEGTMVKWHKKEGDKIKSGEVIGEVETDKATMDLESFEGGVLAFIKAREGDKVKVGDLIAVVAASNEKAEDLRKHYAQGNLEAKGAPVQAPEQPDSGAVIHEAPVAGGIGALQAAAKSAAPAAGSAPRRIPPAVAPAAPAAPAENGDRVRVSPLARRIADEKGIDLSHVRGSGPNGRIVQKDVLEFQAGGSAPAPAAAPAAAALPSRVASGSTQTIELTKMRQTIALRLQQSKQQLPHFYETLDIDAEALVRLREQLNQQLEAQGVRLSLSDLINKALATALTRHPALNAHFDAAANRILRFGDVHLGIAVALPDGLIVPVLRNIDQMGLREIRVRAQDLVERARAGRLKREELSGATFTVSTLGAFGIREFSAIINPPEVGILAVGSAEKRAVVRNDQVVARTMMTVTLSVDHRAVDGASAAEFLRTLRHLMEEPALMLM